MRVMIAGIDGYLGWPLALSLAKQGHTVGGIDNYLRRRLVQEVGCQSAIPVLSMPQRMLEVPKDLDITFWERDLRSYPSVCAVYREFQPEAIVYLGEMPSAPYSMKSAQCAVFTHENNVNGTLATLFAMRDICPEAHLIKLGTMGEYGTPECDIAEGVFPPGSEWWQDLGDDYQVRGDLSGLMFPRAAGSFYHQTKVHDSHNVAFTCRTWGLRSTDIMQGVVYGTRTEAMGDNPGLRTRFDFDECFGTVLNRYCAQVVIGKPLTPYGRGGQTRGFIPLKDSIKCMTLALGNPPEPGEYRTLNQFAATYSVYQLAEIVRNAAARTGIRVRIESVDNPRVEAEQHCYAPDHQGLFDLGYRPTLDIKGEVASMLDDLVQYRQRIEDYRHCLPPATRWDPRG